MNILADPSPICVNMQLCFNYCGLVYNIARGTLLVPHCQATKTKARLEHMRGSIRAYAALIRKV